MALFRLKDNQLVQLTAQEEADKLAEIADYQANIEPEAIRRLQYKKSIKDARVFDKEEELALLAVYDEVKRYRLDNTAQTPLIDAIQTVFPGQTKAQIGTTIESRVESYLVASATVLAQKIKDTP